jgi:hypothetical protein
VAKAWFLLLGMSIGVGCGVVAEAQLPTASAPVQAAPAAKKRCKINAAAPNPAETALNKKEYSSAESLFREMLAKDANDEVAHEGLVRALVEQDKVDAAAKDAETWSRSGVCVFGRGHRARRLSSFKRRRRQTHAMRALT